MLWLCLLLPSLPLDVFARAQTPADAAKPFAVTTSGHYPRVVLANAAARAAGIADGQLISAALAFKPDLVMRERDLQAETSALEAIASWCTQFTPMVSLAPPNAIVAEIVGSVRLFGGIERLVAEFICGADDLGVVARIALAPTPTAAHLLARAGETGMQMSATRVRRSPSEADSAKTPCAKARSTKAPLEQMLTPLPLAKLNVDAESIALLAAAGITTIGQAASLPRNALARRVGHSFVDTLDRARGLIPDPRLPFVPPLRFERKLELPAIIEDVESLLFALNRLVHELAGWLSGRGLGVVELSLSLVHERHAQARLGIPATVVRFGLAEPARDPAHLVAVLRERLARVVLPAPIIAIVLASDETAALSGRNLGLLPGDDAPAVVPLIDRLRARLGDDCVLRVAPHAEHRPERAWEIRQGGRDLRPPTPESTRSVPACNVRDSTPPAQTKPVRTKSGMRTAKGDDLTATLSDPRPVWLLAQPEPIGHALESKPWVLRDGPERIESGWWDGADVRRDYFVAESPRGERVWIYRDHKYGIEDGEWFMHGLFA